MQRLIGQLFSLVILLTSCLDIPIERTLLSKVTTPDGRIFKVYLVAQGAVSDDAIVLYEGGDFEIQIKAYNHLDNAELKLEGDDRLLVIFGDQHDQSRWKTDTIFLHDVNLPRRHKKSQPTRTGSKTSY
ncbi:MAG: hypothetical protein EOO01_26975 [Chitinophagaceae bacterium]|nr:MAG: hypothetical protein EOO01_26975 [Chitinophagaceae bacterium]